MTRYSLSIGALGLAAAVSGVACERTTEAITPDKLEQRYGIAGYSEDVFTEDGAIKGTIVPVTLPDGRQAQLVIPQRRTNATRAVYVRDDEGLHPVQVTEGVTRDQVRRAPVVARRAPIKKKRSWEKDALIIGGSAGGGALIGAVAGGKKGAAIGATAGGIGGLIYDLARRDKD